MKGMKKVISLLLVGVMVLSLVGCGGNTKTEDVTNTKTDESASITESVAESVEPTESTSAVEEAIDTSERADLIYYVIGDAPEDEVMVEDAVNEILLEKVNATIDFQFSTWTDWAQKYNLQLTSGAADLIYVANWNNYGTLASSGAFLELDDMLPLYGKNILDVVSEDSLNMCKVLGSVYAIPGTWPEYTCHGIKYREDLREKYNLPVPDSIEDMETFFMGIKEKDPSQTILTSTTLESTGLQTAFDAVQVFNVKYNWVSNNGLQYGLAANYDTPSEVYDYWYSEEFVEDMKIMKKWADLGFWSRSALSDSGDSEDFDNGLCVAKISGQNPNKYITSVTNFEKDHPDWKAEYLAYGEITGAIYPAHATANATAIVRGTKYPERAMMVLDLLLTDKELNNLVQCGIEGVHYELDQEGYYKNLSETFKYEGFNTWDLRNNDFKIPQQSDKLFNALGEKYSKLGSQTKTPNINIGAGFSENYEAYSIDRNAVSDVMRQYLAPIQAGFVDDVDASIAEFLEKAEAAGLSNCREAYKEQWVKYCEEYGY